MVLDKKFNLVLTKSTQTDGPHFTAMVISVRKVPAKYRQKRIHFEAMVLEILTNSSSYVKQQQKWITLYLQWL